MCNNEKYVVALGTFDGLHKGHEAVLNSALGIKGLIPVAVTFNEPPKRQVTGKFVPMLMSAEDKNERLRQMGFKEVFVLDYNEVHDLSPKAFLDMLFDKYDIKAAVCGFDYRFGKGGEGNAAFLSAYCNDVGAQAVVCPVTSVSGQVVSSTLIRELISNGNVSFANLLLGRPFSFKTTVEHGDGRGHTLGFPTLNQPLDENLAQPKFGVYASIVAVDDKEFPSVTNIGIRPTFVLKKPLSETYIFDFNGDLYGKQVAVKLLNYIRPEERFNSAEELKKKIQEDKEIAKKEFLTYKNFKQEA